MGDIRSRPLIVLKGLLFLAMSVLAGVLLVAESPRWQTAALAGVLAWASARSYYFLFYVLHAYVDPSLRYAGIGAMLSNLMGRRGGGA
ncbi:hypothetical protein OJF2_67120 [Aquisphaera giovannonii]|uniref:Uncharacterized protein n=1 Tax=Aquisphaera giovannonii TaxID=406548 RepID=A0A5B9WCW0_9BACT|nr:hypothetical protein [Aquisphaera giovannonii]QEH38114.1 hypothetical protein OJF2_67120 [Aquisphaera giovannonii]